MDNRSKIFLYVFFVLIFAITVFSFFKYYVWKDYLINTEVDCDPAAEQCFVFTCDPTEDADCPENPAERVSYYKLIEKKASSISLCDPNSVDCPPLSCENDKDCKETFCDETNKGEDECNNPEEYRQNQQVIDGQETAESDESTTPDEPIDSTVPDPTINNE